MKKLILGFILLFSIISFGQEKLKLRYEKDITTNTYVAFLSKKLLCSTDGIHGFVIEVLFENNYGVIKYNGLLVQSNGVGKTMNYDDELTFFFEDDTQYTVDTWGLPNYQGRSLFDCQNKAFPFLNKVIKQIRLINGKTHESYSYFTYKKEEKNYFIDAHKALEEGYKY